MPQYGFLSDVIKERKDVANAMIIVFDLFIQSLRFPKLHEYF
jgi:hypothetical protein